MVCSGTAKKLIYSVHIVENELLRNNGQHSSFSLQVLHMTRTDAADAPSECNLVKCLHHQLSLYNHGFYLAVPERFVVQEVRKRCPWCSPRKENQGEVRWPWHPPDTCTSANPFVWECNIKERCYLELIMMWTTVLLEQDVCCLTVFI
jgi:hypothetical protein